MISKECARARIACIEVHMKNVMHSERTITLKIICASPGEWIGRLIDQRGVLCSIAGHASPQAVVEAALAERLDFDRIEVVPSRLQDEISALDRSNTDLAAGRMRIERQVVLVRKLKDGGLDTAMATTLLVTLEETQQAMLDHRRAIITQIDLLSHADESAHARPSGARHR
jgi:hypothetical protein